MSYLISSLIFFSCTSYALGKSFAIAQEGVFKVGIITIWLVSLCVDPCRRVKNVWLNSIAGFIFITVILLKGQALMVALEPLVNVFLIILLYYSLSNYLKNISPIINGICWAVGAQAIIVLLQGVGLDPICLNDSKLHNTHHFVGLFGYKFVFGAWMAIATPILLFNKKYFFGVLSLIMCILSMSVAPIGIMLASLMVGALFLNKKLALWVISAIIIVGLISWVGVLNKPTNQTLYQKAHLRVTLESKFLPIMFQKPIAGWGLGSFKYIGPQVWNSNTGTYGTMVDAWNDYLQQGVECGIPFIVIFLGMCWDVVKRFRRSVKSPQLIGCFCSLLIIPFGILFHNYFGHASLGVLMVGVFSAFTIRSASYEA